MNSEWILFFYSGAPSVYQTASMLRVLYEVHTHFDNPIIDPVILVRSLDWLIRQQSEDGSFKEVFVYNGEYQRKLPIEFQEIALTAHVLISLSPFIEKVNLNIGNVYKESWGVHQMWKLQNLI